MKKSATRQNKKQKHFSLPDHQLVEYLILVFERTDRNKNEFVTKFVGIIVTIIS